MLCSFHHHLVHEGRWTVTACADGAYIFHSPAGVAVAAEPPRERVERPLDWLQGWARDGGLDLGPWVNMPRCGLVDAAPGP
jgi:hypothetical protein